MKCNAQPAPPDPAGSDLRLLPGSTLDRQAARLLHRFCDTEDPDVFRRLFELTASHLVTVLRLMIHKHCSSVDLGRTMPQGPRSPTAMAQ